MKLLERLVGAFESRQLALLAGGKFGALIDAKSVFEIARIRLVRSSCNSIICNLASATESAI